jgi:hypothetical protein
LKLDKLVTMIHPYSVLAFVSARPRRLESTYDFRLCLGCLAQHSNRFVDPLLSLLLGHVGRRDESESRDLEVRAGLDRMTYMMTLHARIVDYRLHEAMRLHQPGSSAKLATALGGDAKTHQSLTPCS